MDIDLATVIAADHMYLIILGTYETMGQLTNKLNNHDNERHNIEYLMTLIDIPCAEIIETNLIQQIINKDAEKEMKLCNVDDSDTDMYRKYIVLDEGVESAQCLTYAEDYKNHYMLIKLIKEATCFKLSYPILQLDEEVDPEKLISAWIIKNKLANIAKNINIKPISIVGTEHDILVFVAVIEDTL